MQILIFIWGPGPWWLSSVMSIESIAANYSVASSFSVSWEGQWQQYNGNISHPNSSSNHTPSCLGYIIWVSIMEFLQFLYEDPSGQKSQGSKGNYQLHHGRMTTGKQEIHIFQHHWNPNNYIFLNKTIWINTTWKINIGLIFLIMECNVIRTAFLMGQQGKWQYPICNLPHFKSQWSEDGSSLRK